MTNVYRGKFCSLAVTFTKVDPIMNDSTPEKLRQWADPSFSFIETPKHKEGKVEFAFAGAAEYHSN
jgi:hypothetical protein